MLFTKADHLTGLFKNKIDLRILVETIDFDELIEGLAIDEYYVESMYEILD